jgi:hypothetical protein
VLSLQTRELLVALRQFVPLACEVALEAVLCLLAGL